VDAEHIVEYRPERWTDHFAKYGHAQTMTIFVYLNQN